MTKIPCPNCNCPGNFGEQKRDLKDGMSEMFIRCGVCRWERVTLKAPTNKIKRYRRLSKLKARFTNNPKQLKLVEQQIKKLNAETNK